MEFGSILQLSESGSQSWGTALGKAGVVRTTSSFASCTFICQDQLLALALFLPCPLERGGSQLEKGARGYALSPL